MKPRECHAIRDNYTFIHFNLNNFLVSIRSTGLSFCGFVLIIILMSYHIVKLLQRTWCRHCCRLTRRLVLYGFCTSSLKSNIFASTSHGVEASASLEASLSWCSVSSILPAQAHLYYSAYSRMLLMEEVWIFILGESTRFCQGIWKYR
jgi:hypothetical protein